MTRHSVSLRKKLEKADHLRASDRPTVALAYAIAHRMDRAHKDYRDGAISTPAKATADRIAKVYGTILQALRLDPAGYKVFKEKYPTDQPGTQPEFDPEQPVRVAVSEVVADMPWASEDDPFVVTALACAEDIDFALAEFYNGDISQLMLDNSLTLAPVFLELMKSLGATPDSRIAILGATEGVQRLNVVDELKAKRRAKLAPAQKKLDRIAGEREKLKAV